MDADVAELTNQADEALGEGDLDGANQALQEAVRLDPTNASARASLGHVAYARGDVAEATRLLEEAAHLAPSDPGPLRSLLEVFRSTGGSGHAAANAAEALIRLAPDDVLAHLDLAEIELDLGDLDESLAAYRKVRDLDTEPGHPIYALHGMIEVELRRDGWRRALDLAIAATALDRHQLTTDALAFVSTQLFGGTRATTSTGSETFREHLGHAAPAREDLERRLADRRAEHRRIHLEALVA